MNKISHKNILIFFVIFIYGFFSILLENLFMVISFSVILILYFLNRLMIYSQVSVVYFEIIFIIALLQMIIFPLLNFSEIQNPSRYFFIVFLGYFSFILGCNINRKKIYLTSEEIRKYFSSSNNIIICKITSGVGLLVFILSIWFNNSYVNTFSSLAYIGIVTSVALIFVDFKKYCYFIYLYILFFLFISIKDAVFAIFIGLGLLLFSYVGVFLKVNKMKFILLVLFSVFMLNLIHNVKISYRELVWSGTERGFSVSKFFDALFMEKNQEASSAFERSGNGVVTSRIYEYVPTYYPHKYGDKLISDLSNILIPRIIYPDKEALDNSESYRRYTGNIVSEETSVGTNVFGISYAEFGVFGSFLFLFLLGRLFCFINNFYYYIYIYKGNLFALMLLPVIFSNFYKFEQEFVGQFAGWLKNIIFVTFYLTIIRFRIK